MKYNTAILTQKENAIVGLLKQGLRPKQIAFKLDSSPHTVNTHISNIKSKCNCLNIFQLGLFLGASPSSSIN